MTSDAIAIKEAIAESNPEALLADGLEPALVGYTVNQDRPSLAVYDIDLCVQALVSRDGMTEADAEEFLSFNTLGAHVGPQGPLFVRFPR